MGTTLILSGVGYRPRVCYENLFNDADATVSASSEQAGFEKQYAHNWQRYNWWQANAGASEWIKASFTSAKSVDYFALYDSDLFDNSASVTLQYSDDDAVWSDAFSAITPSDNGPILAFFDSISAQYWRILVNSPTTGSKIGIISFGQHLELERNFGPGFEPPETSRDVQFVTKQSTKGVLLARRIQYSRLHFKMEWSLLSHTFIENDWLPFMKHLEIDGGFFLLWDPVGHPQNAVYCEVTNPSWIGTPRYQDRFYMTTSLETDGYIE